MYAIRSYYEEKLSLIVLILRSHAAAGAESPDPCKHPVSLERCAVDPVEGRASSKAHLSWAQRWNGLKGPEILICVEKSPKAPKPKLAILILSYNFV